MAENNTKNIVKKPNQFGKLDMKDIIEFEKENDIKLPKDYLIFLQINNGGKPIKNQLENPSTLVHWLFGFHDGPDWANIFNAIDCYLHRIPSWYFPIGSDPFGNLFIMSLFKENHGLIAFWDHEKECEGDADQYFDNLTFISSSFKELLEKLY